MTCYNINDLDFLKRNVNKDAPIVCLYSGGIDSTFLLFTLKDLGYDKLFALTADVGQSSLADAKRLSDKLSVQWVCLNAKAELVSDFILPSIYCQGAYLGGHPISASLSRPLIAKKSMQFCQKHDFKIILHTSTPSQNSLRRFDSAFMLLDFSGGFGSPLGYSNISRHTKLEKLKSIGIDWVSNRTYSMDDNLWSYEFEFGKTENPEDIIIPDEMLKWTRITNRTPSEICLTFDHGIPTAIDGISKNGVDIVQTLNRIVGSYGHGIYVWLEELQDGKKVQEMREAPAAFILFDAYRRLESATLSSEQIREKMNMEQLWVREASEGRWFGKLRRACQAFCYELAQSVNGEISYIITPEKIIPRRIKANKPLYIVDRQAYEDGLSAGV